MPIFVPPIPNPVGPAVDLATKVSAEAGDVAKDVAIAGAQLGSQGLNSAGSAARSMGESLLVAPLPGAQAVGGILAVGGTASMAFGTVLGAMVDPFNSAAPGGPIPVARVGDYVLCPMHGITVIITGGSQVSHGKHVARKGDHTSCGATIVTGCSSRTVDDKPVARVGDRTDHGGVIITGDTRYLVAPGTVGTGGMTPERFTPSQLAELVSEYASESGMSPTERNIRSDILTAGGSYRDIEKGAQFKFDDDGSHADRWDENGKGLRPIKKSSHNDVMKEGSQRRGEGVDGSGVLYGKDRTDDGTRVQLEHDDYKGNPYNPLDWYENPGHVGTTAGNWVSGDQFGPHGTNPHGDSDPIPLNHRKGKK